jgi:transposase
VSKARLGDHRVVVENRAVAEVATAYGVHRAWIYKLLTRYRAEGEAASPREAAPPLSRSAGLADSAVNR